MNILHALGWGIVGFLGATFIYAWCVDVQSDKERKEGAILGLLVALAVFLIQL